MLRTDNESRVLKEIIKEPRCPNMTIARRLDLSSAGVGKIRDKLGKRGLIQGYRADINLEALGLNSFAILHIRVTPAGWKYNGGRGVEEYIVSNPNIVSVYRVPGGEVTHILFCVFRNLTEIDSFLHVIQAQLSDYLEVVESYLFSHDSILKDTYNDLLLKIVDEVDEERMPEPLLFGHIVGED